MRAVKSKGNMSTELRLIDILRAAGLTGWRRHVDLAGKPDFAWLNLRVAVFVDGCFWHGCPRCGRRPARNAQYWQEKIDGNIRRDRRVARQLRARGWSVIRIWEHSLSNPQRVAARIKHILERRSLA